MRYELSFEESKSLCVAIQGFRLLKEMMLLVLLARDSYYSLLQELEFSSRHHNVSIIFTVTFKLNVWPLALHMKEKIRKLGKCRSKCVQNYFPGQQNAQQRFKPMLN